MLLFKTAYLACIILLLTSDIKSECLQSSFPHAEVRICAGKCIVQTVQNCVDSDSFIGDVIEVSFLNTKVPNFRRAMFNNMLHLKHIDAANTGIKRIYPGTFHNTPNLQSIDLIFNYIEEIPWGVFNNMTFEEITISWNKLSHIEEEAFSNMPNLKVLRLTKNKLDKFDKEWLKGSTNLEVLNLSYNRIGKLWARAFDTFPNLARLDLSFNQILEIGGQAFKNVKSLTFLDLTSNNLTALSTNIFPEKIFIKQFRIPLNRLSFLSEIIFETASVQSIALNPNPWQCPCLKRITEYFNKHKITILGPNADHRIYWNEDLPACAFKEEDPNVCVLGYDEEFLSTQQEYFKEVQYLNVVREKPTSEPPNFDVLAVDHSMDNLSPL